MSAQLLPTELIDVIFWWANAPKTILPFKKYMSTKTITSIANNNSYKNIVKSENIALLKILVFYSDYNDLKKIKYISMSIADAFPDQVNWKYVSKFTQVSEKFINKYANFLIWFHLCQRIILSKEMITMYYERIYWRCVLIYQKISFEQLEDLFDVLEWDLLPKYQKLDEDFIIRNMDKLDMDEIYHFQTLSYDFIENHLKIMTNKNWNNLSIRSYLTLEFLFKHGNNVNWYNVISFTQRSKNFWHKFIASEWFKPEMWLYIFKHQYCTESFIDQYLDQFIDKLYILYIIHRYQYKNISREFTNIIVLKIITHSIIKKCTKHINSISENFIDYCKDEYSLMDQTLNELDYIKLYDKSYADQFFDLGINIDFTQNKDRHRSDRYFLVNSEGSVRLDTYANDICKINTIISKFKFTKNGLKLPSNIMKYSFIKPILVLTIMRMLD